LESKAIATTCCTRLGPKVFPFAEKYFGSRVLRQRLGTTLDSLCIQLCSGVAGVSVRLGEHLLHGRLVKSILVPNDGPAQIDEVDLLLWCNLPRPATVALCVANDLADLPAPVRNGRADTSDRTFRKVVRYVLAQTLAVSVHTLVNLEDRVLDLATFFADSVDRTLGTSGIVERTIIVMAPLERDDVARV
jgi:hypothetical protein